MRSSESHRIVFHETPVLAVLGGPGELVREPYFARDAVRTAVSWARIADLAVRSTLDTLAAKCAGREPDELVSLAAGRILAAQKTIDRWLEHAARVSDADPEASLAPFATELRATVSERLLGNFGRGRARGGVAPVRGRGSPGPREARPRYFPVAAPGGARADTLRAARDIVPPNALVSERLDRAYFERLYLRTPQVRAYPGCPRRTPLSAGVGGRRFHRGVHGDDRAAVWRAHRRGRLREGRRRRQREASALPQRSGRSAFAPRGDAGGPVRPGDGLGGFVLPAAGTDTRRAEALRGGARSGRRAARRPLAQRDEDIPASGGRGA